MPIPSLRAVFWLLINVRINTFTLKAILAHSVTLPYIPAAVLTPACHQGAHL